MHCNSLLVSLSLAVLHATSSLAQNATAPAPTEPAAATTTDNCQQYASTAISCASAPLGGLPTPIGGPPTPILPRRRAAYGNSPAQKRGDVPVRHRARRGNDLMPLYTDPPSPTGGAVAGAGAVCFQYVLSDDAAPEVFPCYLAGSMSIPEQTGVPGNGSLTAATPSIASEPDAPANAPTLT